MVLGSSGDYGMEVFVGGRIWKEFAPKAGAPADVDVYIVRLGS